MAVETMTNINLQWKGTDACYDLYCECSPEMNQHFCGFFGDTFICGQPNGGHGDPEEWDNYPPDGPAYCGKKWRIPHEIIALEIT
jgi:hypothetical protein